MNPKYKGMTIDERLAEAHGDLVELNEVVVDPRANIVTARDRIYKLLLEHGLATVVLGQSHGDWVPPVEQGGQRNYSVKRIAKN